MTVASIVTLADVLPHLNMGLQVPQATLSKLQGFIDDVTPVIEDIVGHVIPAQFDEYYDGGSNIIALRQLPVLSIQSVSEVIGITAYSLSEQPVGSSLDNYGYSVNDPAFGLLTRRGYGGFTYQFYRNTGNIHVLYTAGRLSVPGNIRMGALELIRHWYQIGQEAMGRVGSYAPSSVGEDDDTVSATPSGYLVPNRVKEALEPSRLPPVIA